MGIVPQQRREENTVLIGSGQREKNTHESGKLCITFLVLHCFSQCLVYVIAGDTSQEGTKQSMVRAGGRPIAASRCFHVHVSLLLLLTVPLLTPIFHSLDVFFRWLFDKKFLAEAAVRFE